MGLMSEKIIVGIADMKMTKQTGTLITYALGSCIGICLYDPMIKLAAMVHVMLPLNMETGRKNAFKYVDSGIRETMNQMVAKGAGKGRIVAKIAGGAKMFEITGGTLGNIGQRNIESVQMIFKRENIRLLAQDVGGNVARTMLFDAENGRVCIRSYGHEDKIF